jgi:hypothetical protein
MAGDWTKKRVLIVVRTYPTPAKSTIEASCTAAISQDNQWVRMFPVPARLMEQDKRFRKWQWIDVSLLKASSDSRPESYKLNPESIHIGESVGTENGWHLRRKLIAPPKRPSICRIQSEREERGHPTLGIFHPYEIKRLLIEPAAPSWTDAQLSTLSQDTLFEKAPANTLEKIPFDFRYEFRCGDVDCRSHTMLCTDWEMGQAYRTWRKEYGDQWEAKFRQRFEAEMIQKNDTHFFVGTVHQHPGSWIIVGLFYPPKEQVGSLL